MLCQEVADLVPDAGQRPHQLIRRLDRIAGQELQDRQGLGHHDGRDRDGRGEPGRTDRVGPHRGRSGSRLLRDDRLPPHPRPPQRRRGPVRPPVRRRPATTARGAQSRCQSTLAVSVSVPGIQSAPHARSRAPPSPASRPSAPDSNATHSSSAAETDAYALSLRSTRCAEVTSCTEPTRRRSPAAVSSRTATFRNAAAGRCGGRGRGGAGRPGQEFVPRRLVRRGLVGRARRAWPASPVPGKPACSDLTDRPERPRIEADARGLDQVSRKTVPSSTTTTSPPTRTRSPSSWTARRDGRPMWAPCSIVSRTVPARCSR